MPTPPLKESHDKNLQLLQIKIQNEQNKNWYKLYMHRVSIEGKSPYEESYTFDSHWKMFGNMIQPNVA